MPSPRVLVAALDLVDVLGISGSESDGDAFAAFLVDLGFVSALVVAFGFATLAMIEARWVNTVSGFKKRKRRKSRYGSECEG